MRAHEFYLPTNCLYFCGHSLGPTPKAAQRAVEQTLQDWKQDAVNGWDVQSWIDLPSRLGEKIAPFIGAAPNTVMICDSTSLNLYKALQSALKCNPKRHIIATTDDNFKADLYIAQGIVASQPRLSLQMIAPEALLSTLNESISVLMITHVDYRSSAQYDMAAITQRCHELGILTVWDLSHSVGAMPIDVTQSDLDFAVGCTYKYLNGGPGAPGFIYMHPRFQYLITPIYGWMGHENPFGMETQYRAQGIRQFNGGTPPILSLKALEGALTVFEGLDLQALYTLSLQYSLLLIESLEALGLRVITPKHKMRGGHVGFYHPQAQNLAQRLINAGIICDYRNPHLIRMGVNPLYISQDAVIDCIATVEELLK